MSEKYQQIKNIFSDILDTEPLKEISIKNYDRKIDYIRDVYNHITKDKYADMKKDAIQFLGISHSQLDDFLIEIICSNLYCDLALILQIIGDKGENKDYFKGKIAGYDANNKKIVSKFDGRLKPKRLNTEQELKAISNDEHKYYAPTVIKAYKETLFVNRTGTKILDISIIFIDIFKALFCESTEQTKNISLIKNYRLWKFTSDTIYEVANIYQQVFNSENSYKYAEFVLLEKLFGLLTLNEILSQGFNAKDIMLVTKDMGKINSLGYSSMTKLIASKINNRNHHVFNDVITQYIHPLCSECIASILKDVITYHATRKIEDRKSIVESLLKTCSVNVKHISGKDLLKNIKSDYIMDMFRAVFDLPEEAKNKEHKTKALVLYLTSLNCSYSYTEDIEDKTITKSIVNDKSYESLSYPQYITYPDFDSEDKPKISHRIKY